MQKPPVMTGTLLGVQTGNVQHLTMPGNVLQDGRQPFWTSGIFKNRATGAVTVRATGIEGDGQADLKNHGGPDNVVLAYDAEHYPIWRSELQLPELAYGAFGENFTVEGFSDESVCIGDIWRVGETLRLQVTQARQPCFKLARRLQRPEIVKLVMERSWGGWYLRVLDAGPAETGMEITLESRVHPEWNAARAVQTMYYRMQEPAPAAELAALPELSARWKRELLEQE